MENLNVIYEDNHIVVVVKPQNIPSQADQSGDIDMLSLVKAYIKEKYNKPGEVYIGLVHRLDRPTGGIMVFARTSKSANRLSEQIKKGEFDFSGILDIERFLDIAQYLGLNAIVRPGPYICAEWDFGGFPAWLYNMPGMRLRSLNAPYMERVASYLFRILKEAEPYYCNNGGPIIAVQIENGYASFGNDVETEGNRGRFGI